MTTHRYEDVLEPNYTPRTTRSEWETVYFPSREEICAAKRIDTVLCSSNLVFDAPGEGDEEALKECREVMQGEVQAGGSFSHKRSTVIASLPDYGLENSGHARIPKADAQPMPLTGESCQKNEAFTWKARFGEHTFFPPPQLFSKLAPCSKSSFPHQYFSFLFIPM